MHCWKNGWRIKQHKLQCFDLPGWQNITPVPRLICDKLSQTCKPLESFRQLAVRKGACTCLESSVFKCVIWPLGVAFAGETDTWGIKPSKPSAYHLLSYLLSDDASSSKRTLLYSLLCNPIMLQENMFPLCMLSFDHFRFSKRFSNTERLSFVGVVRHTPLYIEQHKARPWHHQQACSTMGVWNLSLSSRIYIYNQKKVLLNDDKMGLLHGCLRQGIGQRVAQ